MPDDTYDIPGLKFGLLISDEFPKIDDSIFKTNPEKSTDVVNKLLDQRTQIIDFKEIEGLTIDEILAHKKFQFKNTVVIVAYTNMVYKAHNGYTVIDTTLRFSLILDRREQYKDESIEKIIERTFLEDYSNASKETKKYMKCFLERYRYVDKKEVEKIIEPFEKQKVKQKKKKMQNRKKRK